MTIPTDAPGPSAYVARFNRRWHQFANRPEGLALLILLGAAQAAVWLLEMPLENPRSNFAWRACVLFLLQLASVAVVWNRRDRRTLLVVLLFALLFRCAAWTWPPTLSDDAYRYVWDGQVQLAGINPYAAAPSAEELAALRDELVWPNINRPDAVTVYPPGAQMAFFLFAWLGGDSVLQVKSAALALELVTMALLLLLLARRRIPWGRIILYAWSPLLIAEVCGSGHLDALLLPLLVAAALQVEAKRFTAAGAIIGVATLVKLYPLLLVAALPRCAQPRALLAAALVVLCGYLPYTLWAGTGVIGFLPLYVGVAEDFNIGVRAVLEGALTVVVPHARQLAMVICGATMLGCLAVLQRRDTQGERDFFADARRVIVTFLLLLPTAVHPWYALWLLPFLAIRPAAAGVWLIGMLPLSYLKYDAPGELMPIWVLAIEWVPALALVLFGWLRCRRTEVTSCSACSP